MRGAKGKTIRFDVYEEGAIIEGLNKIRAEKIEKKECADYVSQLMLRIIRTPSRKARKNEAR